MKELFLSFVIFFTYYAYVIELENGEKIFSPYLQYKEEKLFLRQRTIPKQKVKRIIFTKSFKTLEKTAPNDIKNIIRSAEEATKKFPDAGAILLLDKGKFIKHVDGTREYIYHARIKILKEKRKNWANINLYVNEENSKIEVLFARTIKPDGRVYKLSKKDIRIIKPKREGIVYFGKGKIVSFTLPHVEVGDIIEYSYRRYTFNPWSREIFEDNWYFQGEEPFILSSLEVIIPLKDTLVWKGKNLPDKKSPIIKIQNNRKIYKWEYQDIPPVIPEPMMPPLGDVAARIEFSNQPTWELIFDWYSKFQKERMKITPEIKKLADSLVKDAKTLDDSIATIYHWVQQHIRYISIKGAASSGVSGHPAFYTLKLGYGDCTDNAILFSTLLQAIGIEAYPVYIGTNDEVPELIKEVPSFYGNHAITQIFIKDTSFYLDATGDYSRYPSFWGVNHGVYAVNAQKRRIEKVPVPPPEQNKRNYLYRLKLHPNADLDVYFESSYTGDYESGVRGYWINKRKRDIPLILSQMVNEVSPDAEVISYEFVNLFDISKPLKLKIHYKIKNWAKSIKEILLLKLPEIEKRYRFPEVSLSKRKYPIAYETSTEITHRVEIEIPEEMKVEYLPPPIQIKTKHATYKAGFKRTSQKIIFTDDFKRKDRIIPVKDYKEYKELCENIMNYFKKPIILKRR